MTYEEVHRDLFSVNLSNYPKAMYAHCISADFKLGAGIAVQFDRRFNMRRKLNSKYVALKGSSDLIGTSCPIDNTFNLITKLNYWQLPRLESLQASLKQMKEQCLKFKVTDIFMPKIGAGLDRLSWAEVRESLQNEFKDTEVNLHVYYL
ncbi:MAG: hypothetical protein IJK97_09640 [Thermoguttaceae bacterium]|nr:hypothetical protein [Thermoguttaceae bacterium]MBR0193527.1 hypothetical protein [Thermoguttaceae bacterium]